MTITKLIAASTIMIAIVFIGLSLKLLVGKSKKTEGNNNRKGIEFGCGCGNSTCHNTQLKSAK
ncbi:MAG: hypothetical protein H6536_06305 [Bacteroidales bacterium]|nr:hypothetical protein [Bacteroidales bacterium]